MLKQMGIHLVLPLRGCTSALCDAGQFPVRVAVYSERTGASASIPCACRLRVFGREWPSGPRSAGRTGAGFRRFLQLQWPVGLPGLPQGNSLPRSITHSVCTNATEQIIGACRPACVLSASSTAMLQE